MVLDLLDTDSCDDVKQADAALHISTQEQPAVLGPADVEVGVSW
jgi:hypothetical protein